MEKKRFTDFFSQCLRAHILLYVTLCFFFLPKNKVGLEILNELKNWKIQKKLYKRYKYILSEYKQSSTIVSYQTKKKVIWFCWLQGIENAPELVKICFESVRKYCSEYEIILIDSENFKDYSTIPDIIIEKWENGIISNTAFSDILRTNLLLNNGGTWVDSTCFFTCSIPKDIEKSDFFVFRTHKPGSAGKYSTVSNWFISSNKNHLFLQIMNTFLIEYWKKENRMCDYFFYHIFMEIVLNEFNDVSKNIPCYSNEAPHYLFYHLFWPYSEELKESLYAKSFVHKLSNKIAESEKKKTGTFYNKIMESYK